MKKLFIILSAITFTISVFAQPSIKISTPASGTERNTMLGANVPAINSGTNNTFIGENAGNLNTTGTDNTFVGLAGYRNTTGLYNTFLGVNAGSKNITGSYNTSTGVGAGAYNNGNANIFMGVATGHYTQGDDNVIIGDHAAYLLSGNGNVIIGHNAAGGYPGTYLTGTNNMLLGTNSYILASGLSNATAIGYNAKVGQSNTIVLGGTGADAVKVGIGITNPSATFHLDCKSVPNVRFENLPKGKGNILVVDANGYIYRSSLSAALTGADGSSKIIKEQEDKINDLEARLAKLENKEAVQLKSNILEVTEAELFQNIPNPFQEKTQIKYRLPQTTKNAIIYVYDMNGRQIKNVSVQAGEGAVTIESNELSAGMYIYSLVADGKEVSTKRMILTK